jgi:hypothetical protein
MTGSECERENKPSLAMSRRKKKEKKNEDGTYQASFTSPKEGPRTYCIMRLLSEMISGGGSLGGLSFLRDFGLSVMPVAPVVPVTPVTPVVATVVVTPA